jgi:hypothetical protein
MDAADRIPSWLRKLFSTALLPFRVERAHEWVEMTGCILMDLLDDDALTDLAEHLGLRKYESKRLRKALKTLEPETMSISCASLPTRLPPDAAGSPDSESLSSSFAQHMVLNSPAFSLGSPSPWRERRSEHVGNFEEELREEASQGFCFDTNCEEAPDLAEPEPERLLQTPDLRSGELDTLLTVDSTFLLSPVKIMDEATTPCSLMKEVAMQSPGDSTVPGSRVGSPCKPLKPLGGTLACKAEPDLECASPRKVLARQFLEQLGEATAASSDSQVLGTIDATFKNADDVFAAFESFGPGAFAMFEFDDESRQFGLTADAQNIFKALGISHDQSENRHGAQRFQDALESGSMKRHELHSFLETFLGDVPKRDVDGNYEASSNPSKPDEPASGVTGHIVMPPCKDQGCGDCAVSSDTKSMCTLPCCGHGKSEMTVPFGNGCKLQAEAKESAFAPTTCIEATVVLPDACSSNMQLQKRVVDRSDKQRAVIVLELREQGDALDALLTQLDVRRIDEIRQVTPFSSSDDAVTNISFILSATVDSVLYLRPGMCIHKLFHSLDNVEGAKLSLHISVGPSAGLQAEARRFFNGLRLLARLPEDDWRRLATDHASSQAAPAEVDSGADSEKVRLTSDPDLRNRDRRGSTLKVDLSHVLQGELAQKSVDKRGSSAHEKGKLREERDALHINEEKQTENRILTAVAPSSVQAKMQNSTSNDEKIQALEDSRNSSVLFNACYVKWGVVVEAAKARGWAIVTSEEKASGCNVHWVDGGSVKEVFPTIQPWMRVNHFPGTCRAIGRKCRLARTMSRMQMLFPEDYYFVPKSWILPEDFSKLESSMMKVGESKATYIVKPDGLSQGRGIFLTDDLEKIRKIVDEDRESGEGHVVQKYIAKPMLLDGLKFDMRIYLLVVGGRGGIGNDMRMFLFRDGLVRLCTEEYVTPTPDTFDNVHMHLTNYEVNKNSASYKSPPAASEDGENDVNDSNKRSLEWLFAHLETQYGQEERHRIWSDVTSICVKTVLAAQPTLEAEYDACFSKDRTCGGMGCRSFEILGFDIMLNSQRRAYLLEVNHLPSLGCDSPLDQDIKRRLIDQTFDLTCGCVEASVTTKATYDQLVTADQPEIPSGSALLDQAAYKDFDRVFPPGDGCPDDLGKLATTISEKVRGVFGSVMSTRPRAASPPPLSAIAAAERRASTPPPWNSSASPPLFASPCRPGSAGENRAASRPRSSNTEKKMAERRHSCPNGRKSSMVRSSSAPGIERAAATSKCEKSLPRPAQKEQRRGSAWSMASDRGLAKPESTGRLSSKGLPRGQSLVRACLMARQSLK